MKIAVDAGCLGVVDERLKVGVYTVAYNLLLQLSKIDKTNTYLLYSFYPIDEDFMKLLGPRMKNVVLPSTGWLSLWLPLRMRLDQVGVFLGLGQAMPPFIAPLVKKIGYVYDIAFEKYPENYKDSYEQLHHNTAELVKKADHIITLSHAAAQDIREEYGLDSQKISAIHLGVREFHDAKIETNIYGDYFLFVGALKRGKNVPSLLRAFARFYSETSKDFSLLIVGGDKWHDAEIDAVYDELSERVKKQIIFLGFVADAHLPTLYHHATALLSPSFYEGFGLPVVEAMQLGCPVVVSDQGSLPEIVGKAGILVAPTDTKALAHQMKVLATDTAKRNQLKNLGKVQVKKFTWETCAKETLAVINTI